MHSGGWGQPQFGDGCHRVGYIGSRNSLFGHFLEFPQPGYWVWLEWLFGFLAHAGLFGVCGYPAPRQCVLQGRGLVAPGQQRRGLLGVVTDYPSHDSLNCSDQKRSHQITWFSSEEWIRSR